ncbi:ATP-binding cassette sub-family C member 5-like [Glandiceps talaboti]
MAEPAEGNKSSQVDMETIEIGESADGETAVRYNKSFIAKYGPSLKMLKTWRRKKESKKSKCPMDDAGFISTLWYTWQTPLIVKARKGDLGIDQVHKMSKYDASDLNIDRFERLWNEEIKRNGSEEASLAGTFLRFVRTRIITSIVILTVSFYLGYLGAACIVGAMLIYIEDMDKDWRIGLTLTCCMLISEIIRSTFTGWSWYINYRTGIRLRSAALTLIFKKLTSLRNLQDQSVGQFVNLCGNDGQRIFDACQFGPYIIAGPLLAVGVIVISVVFLGWWALIGSLVFILFYPFQVGTSRLMARYRKYAIDVTDLRVRKMNEMVMCVKLIKMYAWETSFSKAIESIRGEERNWLTKAQFVASVNLTVSPFVTLLATVISLTGYVLTGNYLYSRQAFTTVALFNTLRYCIVTTPFAVRGLAETRVSVIRMKSILDMPDYEPCRQKPENPENAIEIKYATFGWDKHEDIDEDDDAMVDHVKVKTDNVEKGKHYDVTLHDIDLDIPKGSLVGVCGGVACGKTSLVSAIMNQMECVQGSLAVDGKFALASQQAWIQNGTFRDNILFSKDYDNERYSKTLEVCNLHPDLAVLPKGESTEIGERGLNLSGGQKQRISLARAYYSDRDIYLLDDPLSAVDAHVGKHLFTHLIKGALKGKSVLFVTHQLQYLSQCDDIIVLREGRVVEHGKHSELIELNGEYAKLISTHYSDDGGEQHDVEDQDVGGNDVEDEVSSPTHSLSSPTHSMSPTHSITSTSSRRLRRKLSSHSSILVHRSTLREEAPDIFSVTPDDLREDEDLPEDVFLEHVSEEEGDAEAGRLTQKEEKGEGSVGVKTYLQYCKYGGGYCTAFGVFFMYLIVTLLQTFVNTWLSVWLDKENTNKTYIDEETGEEWWCDNVTCQESRDFYLIVYNVALIVLIILALFKSLAYVTFTLRASTNMHNEVLTKVFRSPMKFFDTTPSGRIINRFSKDLDEVDVRVSFMLESMLQNLLAIIFSLIMIGFVFPIFFGVLLPLLALFVVIYVYFRAAVRELKRVDNVTRSPWFSHITASALGVPSLHAYEQEHIFNERFKELMDGNSMPFLMFNIAMRWAAIRLDMITMVITTVTTLMVALSHGKMSASFAGLALSFATQNAAIFQTTVRLMAEVEARFTSAERIMQYVDELYEEPPPTIPGKKPPDNWPQEGAIKFVDLKMRYREGLPLVLTGVNLDIKPMEKIGIVGRTGSGKSTLGVALFRLVDPDEGYIDIDGVNCHEIGLHDLRSKLSIIPQDPILFIGTVRYNLDPFNTYDDEQIWTALEKCYMKDTIENLEGCLEAPVVENGENFSVGERQLMCMARALLRNSKILILDEATAAIDTETDSLIQQTIRKAFKHCTMLTIAHRLNTIIDSDRILVMDQGKVGEFDTPTNLMADKTSIFFGMWKAAESSKKMMELED